MNLDEILFWMNHLEAQCFFLHGKLQLNHYGYKFTHYKRTMFYRGKIWFIMVKYTVYRGKYTVCRGILQSGNFWYIIMSKLSHSKSTTWYETAYRDIQ